MMFTRVTAWQLAKTLAVVGFAEVALAGTIRA
jgi:hypothetical protein